MIGFEVRGRRGITFKFGVDQNSSLRLVTVPKGIAGADIENDYIETTAKAGAFYRGTQYKQIDWSIEVHTRGVKLSGDEAVSLWARWRACIGMGEPITLAVKSVGGGERTQLVRMASGMPAVDTDLIRNAKYFRETITPKSDSSYFDKPTIYYDFAAADFATAKVSNVTDVDAPLRYEITGPITSPQLGVVAPVTLTGAVIPAGTTWVVDTDPKLPRIYDKATGLNRLRTVYDAAGGNRIFDNDLVAGAINQPVLLSGSGTTTATKVRVFVPQKFRMGIA